MLRALAVEVSRQMPQYSILAPRKALRRAVEQDQFEEAARLHNALKKLEDHEAQSPNESRA